MNENLRGLFGGAIVAYIPFNACDISMTKPRCLVEFFFILSKIRSVPDNQEVFAHPVTDQSIIVDLLEYADGYADEAAAEYHFKDLTSDNDAKINSIKKLEINLPNCDSIYYLNGEHFMSKYKETAKNLVNLHLVLFRYKQYSTDILITFNDPIYINPQSSSYSSETNEQTANSNKWTVDEFMKTVETFKIVDFSLFC